uniref:ditrans,polycis-polyprenyl diphosphate synthase [(2E,6E)-farnesyldiphosphate specific] n=1 Tax=Graphocephala atropunctata TaxID=36148 RepID=A0A1B6KC73_9HEMI
MVLSSVREIVHKTGVCVLIFLHIIFSIYQYITILSINVSKQFKKFYKRPRDQALRLVSTNLLKEEVKCYPKVPKHLAVVIEEEDISYKDCIKLILWCIYSEIPFISFYSYSGAINPTSLYEVLCKESKNSLQNIQWGKSFHKSVKEMAKKDINGYVWRPIVEVNLFSFKSVNDSIENVMLRLCEESVKPEEISIETVDQYFKDEIPLPDPCLCLVFSSSFSTFGFMPWQIRVTEILHVTTHHHLLQEDFLCALRTYAFCDQRFGK